jgi:hypothetical protein
MPTIDERLRLAGDELADQTDPMGAFDRITARRPDPRHTRTGVRATVLVLAVVGGVVAGIYGLTTVFIASPGHSPRGGTSGLQAGADRSAPRIAAEQEVHRLLSLLRLPPGAVMASTAPVPPLREPGQSVASRTLLDEKRWWTVPMSVADTTTWIKAHPPAGLSLTVTGSGSDGTEDLGFDASPTRFYDTATLMISIAPDGNNTSAIRADGQVTWIPVRPQEEFVPLGVHSIDLVAVPGLNGGTPVYRTLSGLEARHVGALLNDLHVDTASFRSCPDSDGSHITATVQTRAGALVFTEGTCYSVTVTLDGRRLPTLKDSQALQKALKDDLGIH